jgi:competence transcription factor ComK
MVNTQSGVFLADLLVGKKKKTIRIQKISYRSPAP